MSTEVKCEVCKRTFKNKAGIKRHKCTGVHAPTAENTEVTTYVTEAPRGLTVPTQEHPIVSGMYDNIESGWYESAGGSVAIGIAESAMEGAVGVGAVEGAAVSTKQLPQIINIGETVGMTQEEKLQWALDKIQVLSEEITRLQRKK